MHAAGEVDNAVVETVERLLRAPSQMGLYTRVQSLEYLGSMFRGTLDVPARFTDLQVGVNGMLIGDDCLCGYHAKKLPRKLQKRAQALDCGCAPITMADTWVRAG